MFTTNLLTAKQAAQTLAFSEATLRRLRQKGILKAGIHYRRKFAGNPNSSILYKIEECQQALDEVDARDARTLELARG